ncbi:Uncharacterised protein [Vibrio cholerae]|nr:Uncharacterised protein [Vibrio cholerae]
MVETCLTSNRGDSILPKMRSLFPEFRALRYGTSLSGRKFAGPENSD